MQRQHISRSSSADEINDSSLSRVLIRSAEHTSEHTLPLNIIPSSPLITTTRRTIQTQTTQEIISKSVPSFADTQLLSVYYPSKNPTHVSVNDKCIFVEQQNRQPIRHRETYDPVSSAKFTQTSSPPSRHRSTIIIDTNQPPTEPVEESKYSYEEYIVHLDEKQNRTSSSSSSSVTTVIAQNEDLHVSFDDINTQSSLNNQRVSSWPPVPDDILSTNNQNENDEQKRALRVQFAENLVHVIPVSTTTSLSEESTLPPAILPRTIINEKNQLTDVNSRLQRLDYHPINQSKWMQTHMDNSDVQTNQITPKRVDTLRTLFEQPNTRTTSNSQIQADEKPSKYGDEVRFHIYGLNSSTIHHAEPAKVVQHTKNSSNTITQEDRPTSTFNLEQIRQITGKQLKNLNDVGRYLQDGHTWQWNEVFWLSLTTSQRDQLRNLEHRSLSRQNSNDHSLNQTDSELSSSNDTNRSKSTINITGAGAWQQHKPRALSTGNTRYTETNTIDETQPSISVFGTAPSSTSSRIDSQESLASSINQQQVLTSNTRSSSQITVIESGYSSGDDQPRRRSHSKIITEETPSHQPSRIDPLSYEQFIYDYLSTHARHLRSNDGTLILSIDGQQIPMPHIRLPLSNDNITLERNIYVDAIDRHISPFETELDQLVIFIHGEAIFLPADRWLTYREKYNKAQWIRKLKRVNRDIPSQLIPTIEQWLADHATLSVDTHELSVDGLIIPLIGRLGLHILELHKIRQLQTTSWNEILKYLIRTGYVSYNFHEKLIHIAHSQLKLQRLLTPQSSELIERLTRYLHTLDDIHFHNHTLIITENFIIPNEYLQDYLEQNETLNLHELANQLLEICEINEDKNDQSLILTFNKQTLRIHSIEIHIHTLIQWLEQLSEQNLILITEQNDIIIYPKGEHNQDQQISINRKHVDQYMQTKMTEKINLHDIAHILFFYHYVQYSSGQLTFPVQHIVVDTNELPWLQSIIRSVRSNKHARETEIELFDGQHTQIIQIPFEHMSPTNDSQIVAYYLFQNGNIISDPTSGNYIYLYIPSKKKISTVDDQLKEDLIDRYVEYINDHGEIKFDHNNHVLILDNPLDNSQLYLLSEHTQFIHTNQYRREDLKSLLKKYSRIEQDEFGNWLLYYDNQCVQIPDFDKIQNQSSRETQTEFLHRYHSIIDYMYSTGLIICNKELKLLRIHFSNQILTIPIDELRAIINTKILHSSNANILPFSSRHLSQWLLNNCDRISNSRQDCIQLTYKNQLYILPSIPSNDHQENIDPNLILLFPENRDLREIQKTASTTTLDIQQPNETNGYAIDPLLILANYVYRAGTIYQDALGRLVIKLNKDEIVVPHIEAINSIEAINTAPNRTGTIIARLIDRLGKVRSNKAGGIIITIGKRSIELSKETIDRSKHYYNENIPNLRNQRTTSIARLSNSTPTLPLLQHSKSAGSLSSSSIGHSRFTDDQQMLYTKDGRGDARYLNLAYANHLENNHQTLKPRFIIIPSDETTRFYIQYTYEQDSTLDDTSNSVLMLPSRYPVRPTQPQLIAPQHYRNSEFRDASVYVRRPDESEIYYENLAQYLSTNQTDLSPRTVRRMLKFSSRDEFYAYLTKQMSASNAEQLVQESEEVNHIENNTQQRSSSPNIFYNVQNGRTTTESTFYEEQQNNRYTFPTKSIDRSPSSSSLSSDMLITNTFPAHRTILGNAPLAQYVSNNE